MLWLSFSLSLFLSLRYMACGSCQPTHPLLLLLPLGPLLLLLPSIGAIAIAVGCCYWGHCYCCCRWGHWAHPHTPHPLLLWLPLGTLLLPFTAIAIAHCYCHGHSMAVWVVYKHSIDILWVFRGKLTALSAAIGCQAGISPPRSPLASDMQSQELPCARTTVPPMPTILGHKWLDYDEALEFITGRRIVHKVGSPQSYFGEVLTCDQGMRMIDMFEKFSSRRQCYLYKVPYVIHWGCYPPRDL